MLANDNSMDVLLKESETDRPRSIEQRENTEQSWVIDWFLCEELKKKEREIFVYVCYEKELKGRRVQKLWCELQGHNYSFIY